MPVIKFKCGCSVLRYDGPEKDVILGALPCQNHVENEEIQKALKELAAVLEKVSGGQ